MSSLNSEFTGIVWKINSGLKHFPPVLTSEPFFLLGSERKLELRLELAQNDSTKVGLYLRPFLSSSIKDTVVHIMSFMRDHRYLLKSHISSLYTIGEIWSFERRRAGLPDICEILCIFRVLLLPLTRSGSSETIHFTTTDSNLESLSADFDQFLEDKTFTDVTLKCRDRAISAHRAVLAARSPVFEAMFRHKMAESENGVVDLSDLDPDTLESFLKYLYSGRITNLSENNVSAMFSTGDKYTFLPLQRECSRWISKRLNRENYISFLQLADAHNFEDLKNSVIEFIASDNSVLTSDEWSEFKEKNPKLAVFVYERYFFNLLSLVKTT